MQIRKIRQLRPRSPRRPGLKGPHVSGGGSVGGTDTDHVSAELDVVNAANGLLGLVRSLGRDAPTITGKSADQLRKAVKSSSIDV